MEILRETYENINKRSNPVAQEELNGPLTYCKAIWAIDGWIDYKLKELFACLAPLKNEGIFFDNASGILHWTLFQLKTFPIEPDSNCNLENEANVLKQLIGSFPQLRLQFVGISKTRYGLFLNGYPNFDVNALRNMIRTNIKDLVEPHQQDICHTTLFRFTRTPSIESLELIDAVIDRFKDINICDFIPKTWEYGYGTWLQNTRHIVCSWPAVPRWILHRGLLAGPDSDLENNESNFKKRLNEGWDVEIDIWNIDGVFWLGHDHPTSRLEDTLLLTHPNVWVHCKNLEALSIMPSNAHYFVHDNDMATLTSKQFIWCFPGNMVNSRKCVIVLPERVGFKFPILTNAMAVCSDFVCSKFF
jgi:hypothetical protein